MGSLSELGRAGPFSPSGALPRMFHGIPLQGWVSSGGPGVEGIPRSHSSFLLAQPGLWALGREDRQTV